MAAGNKKDKNKTMSLEEAFKALDDLIEAMSDEDITLEESFMSYRKGLELVKYCNDSIGSIEEQLEELSSEESDDTE